ncbi:glutathione S-transferase [Aureimonas populi]|uniref:Glutathione S-transferase n=1 Tax=Aureimonas populi TaxID=1701758 RepID=A0ABW5CGJ3_9HYPH|nr:glutathione S-transferase [Aureimonas populi]
MRLLCSPASPYSVKVRLAAEHCDLPLELEFVDTTDQPSGLVAANPLGKIPTLVLEDGGTVYDSRVICEYLDRISGNLLIPQTTEQWLQAKRVEALADGVADAAILVVYEERFRPAEKRHEGWTDRQWTRAVRGLDRLEAEVDKLPEALNIGHFALAAVLGWLNFRFKGKWEDGHPGLVLFVEDFGRRFAPFTEISPRA